MAHPVKLVLLAGGQGPSHIRESRGVEVGHLPVQLPIALGQGQHLGLVGGFPVQESPQFHRDGPPDLDDLRQVLPLQIHQIRDASLLGGVQNRQETFPAVTRQGRADGIVLLAHGRGGLHAEAPEIHPMAFRAEVGVRLQRTRIPGEHLAGVGHDGHVDVVGHAALVQLFSHIRPSP